MRAVPDEQAGLLENNGDDRMRKSLGLLPVALVGMTMPAMAHPGSHIVNSFAAGFFHPLTGLDHMLALLAVGVLAAQGKGLSRLALPGAFLAAMLAGGVLGANGVVIPAVEPGILASVFVLGLLVAFSVQLPLLAGGALTAAFAFLHGQAHGAELAGAAALPFVSGFIAASIVALSVGVAGGEVARRFGPRSAALMRAGGAVIAALGVGMAFAG